LDAFHWGMDYHTQKTLGTLDIMTDLTRLLRQENLLRKAVMRLD